MDKALIIKNICELLLDNRRKDCVDFANTHYPFHFNPTSKRGYSKYQMCRIFIRDGFIDRYSGDRLLFPGLIKLLTIEIPEIFKYQKNWKMTETHLIYWELFPTIDHIVPVARGGQDNESNLVTTSMIRNSAKSNWTIEQLGWKLHDRGQLKDWDGLINCFMSLIKKNETYSRNKYIMDWTKALIKAKRN